MNSSPPEIQVAELDVGEDMFGSGRAFKSHPKRSWPDGLHGIAKRPSHMILENP